MIQHNHKNLFNLFQHPIKTSILLFDQHQQAAETSQWTKFNYCDETTKNPTLSVYFITYLSAVHKLGPIIYGPNGSAMNIVLGCPKHQINRWDSR